MQLRHEPHRAVSALAAYIQAGCSSEAVLHPTPGSRLVQQVLSLGHKLIQLHQASHMHQLLALAGDAAHTLGAAFLKVAQTSSLLQLLEILHKQCIQQPDKQCIQQPEDIRHAASAKHCVTSAVADHSVADHYVAHVKLSILFLADVACNHKRVSLQRVSLHLRIPLWCTEDFGAQKTMLHAANVVHTPISLCLQPLLALGAACC